MKRVLAAALAVIMLFCLAACNRQTPEQLNGFAMDTRISVSVYGDGGKYTASECLNAVSELENIISWNIEQSDTSALNSTGSVESKTLADIISPVLSLTADTNGVYSLAVREICALWDVTSDNPKIPEYDKIKDVLSRTGGVPQVDGDTVSLPEGHKLDLGSVGKGAACDMVAEILNEKGASGIAAIGSSLALCGQKPDGKKWVVIVAHPDNRNGSVGTLSLDGGTFVSTSGDSARGFTVDGVRYHHIISAVSGYPARTRLRSVTVISDSGVLSDALSTACYLVGYEKACLLLEKYGAEAVFVTDSLDVICTSGIEDRFEVER